MEIPNVYGLLIFVIMQMKFWCNLTHWGRVTHICVSRLTIIGSDNGLSPEGRQAIIWTNAGILFIGPLGTNFSENSIEFLTFSFTKMRLKVSSAKWRPSCLGLNELKKYKCKYSRTSEPDLSDHIAQYSVGCNCPDTHFYHQIHKSPIVCINYIYIWKYVRNLIQKCWYILHAFEV